MPQTTRTFRVFVSSTFDDLKAERNALQEKVFPELQKLCEANGCRFQAVDLRWGVSEEAALDQQTMNICLTELKRCQVVSPRPNFIILLGDRYGWIPLPPQVEASEFREILLHVKPEDMRLLKWDETLPDGGGGWYRLDTNADPPEYVLRPRREEVFEEADHTYWGKTEERLRAIVLGAINSLAWPVGDTRRIKYECSATHQEIIEGALKLPDEREHVFAFLRNIRNIEDLPPGSAYTDAGLEKARTLKDKLSETKGVSTYLYDVTWADQPIDTHIGQFVADALLSLRRIIGEEIQQLKQIDELTREDIAHKKFGFERSGCFAGRQKILEDIATYVRGSSISPLVVHGSSGSGKSALMARAANAANACIEQAHVVQRFVGATPESTVTRSLLTNLIRDITRAYEGNLDTIPSEYSELKTAFVNALQRATRMKPLLLFIDGLDQLSSPDSGHTVSWVPSLLPANVKIIISVLEEEDTGKCLASLKSRLPETALIRLNEMTQEEANQALANLLLQAYPENDRRSELRKKRTLTREQKKAIISRFAGCPRPLYLKLAFEQARHWKCWDGTPELPANIPGIVRLVIERLRDKRQHGEVLVKTFLGLLGASRYGLSETEILEILSSDRIVMADLKARSARSPDAPGVPAVVWLRLYHDLEAYLFERSAYNTTLIDLYHSQVRQIVKQDYVYPERHIHLAQYFEKKADPAGDSTWSGDYVHGLAELPYHKAIGGQRVELRRLLGSIPYLEATCRMCDVYQLLESYELIGIRPEDRDDAIAEKYRDFIHTHVQKFSRYKDLFFSLLRHEGFREAIEQSDDLIASGRWKRPWIRTEWVMLPESAARSRQGGKVEIQTRFEYGEWSCAADAAEDTEIGFFVRRLGSIAVVDLSKMMAIDDVIVFRNLRPLTISCSPQGKFLAIAYENGEVDIIRLFFERDGVNLRFRSQADVGTFKYWRPECEDPVIRWNGETLCYQENYDTLVEMNFASGCPILKQYSLPPNVAGELSSEVTTGNVTLFSIRQRNATVLGKLTDGTIECVLRVERDDVSCASKCGNNACAFAFSGGTILIISVQDEPRIVSQLLIASRITGMTYSDGKLYLVSDTLGVSASDVRQQSSEVRLVDEGELHSKTSRVGLQRIQPLTYNTIRCIAKTGIFDLKVVQEAIGFSGTIRSVFAESGERCCGLLKRGEELWMADCVKNKEYLLVNAKSHLYVCGMDIRGNVLAAEISSGQAFVLDRVSGNLSESLEIPVAVTSIATCYNGGFWLCDRFGGLYHLSTSGACTRSADLSKLYPSGASVLAWPDVVVWNAYSHHGLADASPMLVFFDGKDARPGKLRMQGSRLFLKEGPLCMVAYDDAHKKLFVALWYDSQQVVVIKHGSIADFVKKNENEHSLENSIGYIIGGEYVHSERLIYLLSKKGEIFVIDPVTFKIKGHLFPSSPFTQISALVSNDSTFYAVEKERKIYKCRLEG